VRAAGFRQESFPSERNGASDLEIISTGYPEWVVRRITLIPFPPAAQQLAAERNDTASKSKWQSGK